MKIQTICKEEATKDNPCCQNINLVFPSSIGLITGIGTAIDTNHNTGNSCNTPNPVFDASLFLPTEQQFGLHIKNKQNNYKFSQVATPNSIDLMFETLNSKRSLNIYADKITVCDGTLESPITTLTDLFSIGLIDEDGNPTTAPDMSVYATNVDFNKLSTSVSELSDKLIATNDTLETKIDDLETEVDDLETKVNTLETKVDTLETKVDTLETKVDTLETKVDTLETKVNTLETKVNTLETKVNDLETQNDTLLELTNKLSTDNETLQTEVNDLKTQNATLSAQISDLQTQIDTIKQQIPP